MQHWSPPMALALRKCKECNTFALGSFMKRKEYNTLAAHASSGSPYGSRDVEMQNLYHFRLGVL